MKKRDQKAMRKYESNKLGESGNYGGTPNLNNPFKDATVSPSLLPMGRRDTEGGNKSRKLTND